MQTADSSQVTKLPLLLSDIPVVIPAIQQWFHQVPYAAGHEQFKSDDRITDCCYYCCFCYYNLHCIRCCLLLSTTRMTPMTASH
jgi:hypothetical protein